MSFPSARSDAAFSESWTISEISKDWILWARWNVEKLGIGVTLP
jgi:hypothetical protein